MRQFAGRLSLVLTALSPALVGGQSMPEAPAYTVLNVFRETVKPGKGPAHDEHESAWARAVAAAKPPNGYLTISAMSGSPENWYISPFANWAAMEKANAASAASPALTAISKQYSAKEDEYLNDGRAMILTLRQDLSYGQSDLAASRYFTVQRVSVRIGHTDEFEANRKMIKAAHESTKMPDSYSIWAAASGAPAGTYFIFSARKSLSEIDEQPTTHGAAYQAALGGAEGQKTMLANTLASVNAQQTDLFAFAPQQSIPPPEWVKADPAFWAYKVAPKKTP